MRRKNIFLLFLLAALMVFAGCGKAEKLLEEAELHFADGKMAEAESIAREVIAEYPDHAETAQALIEKIAENAFAAAEESFATGDLAEAETAANVVLSQYAETEAAKLAEELLLKLPEAYFAKAENAFAEADFSLAREETLFFLEKYPEDARVTDAKKLLGKIEEAEILALLEAGDYISAKEKLTNAEYIAVKSDFSKQIYAETLVMQCVKQMQEGKIKYELIGSPFVDKKVPMPKIRSVDFYRSTEDFPNIVICYTYRDALGMEKEAYGLFAATELYYLGSCPGLDPNTMSMNNDEFYVAMFIDVVSQGTKETVQIDLDRVNKLIADKVDVRIDYKAYKRGV
ncbi:MAG: hypothetical protein E7332_01665 [Clostridiales bacterium]|nr:hypothetical protein [Clostridiales bacterium]